MVNADRRVMRCFTVTPVYGRAVSCDDHARRHGHVHVSAMHCQQRATTDTTPTNTATVIIIVIIISSSSSRGNTVLLCNVNLLFTLHTRSMDVL